ncbi:MAG: AMP-dependent synthetase/ligase, partial [Bacteroidales bacterium]
NIYLWEKTGSAYEGTTYQQVHELVEQFAAGLLSLGVAKGDRIALLSEGRNAWVVSELGMLFIGAINIPLSVKLNEPNEIKYRLAHAGVSIAIASGNQANKIRDIQQSLAGFKKLIILDGEAGANSEIAYQKVLDFGKQFLTTSKDKFLLACQAVQPTDPANICYTSGTTADPKGIVLSHNNYVANVYQGYTLMDIPPHFTTLLILPWDHAFAHTAGIYCMMGKGASMASIQVGKSGMETLKNIPINIKENKPHLLMSVPALAGNFKKNIEKGISDKGFLAKTLFKHALRISYSYNNDGWNKGRGLTFIYKPLMKLYDKILFSKIREGFGGRLEFFIGGGALLDIEFQRFFYAIGMPMFQGYGLTEAAPIISSNSLAKHKLGSSGHLVKNLQLKICDEKGRELPVGEHGEIVIKGENVMLGYWNNPEATAQSLREGWLYTGDLGYMDLDGFLYVLGRFKSLLIADDGEKFSPEGIEEAYIGQSQYISQSMLFNNQHPYTIGLIVPDKSKILEHLRHKNLDPASDAGIHEAIRCIGHELNQYRKHGHYGHMFPHRWLPAAIGILPAPFTEENSMMNSTMKMVRGKIVANYKQLIDFLYTSEGKDLFHKQNMENMRTFLGK